MMILVESYRDGMLSRTTTISGGGGCNALGSRADVHDGASAPCTTTGTFGTTMGEPPTLGRRTVGRATTSDERRRAADELQQSWDAGAATRLGKQVTVEAWAS